MQVATSCCTAPAASVVFNVLISCVRSDGVDLTLERFFLGCALKINALTALTLICVLEMNSCPNWSMTVLYKISRIINAKASLLVDTHRCVIFAKVLFVANIQNQ